MVTIYGIYNFISHRKRYVCLHCLIITIIIVSIIITIIFFLLSQDVNKEVLNLTEC